MTPGAMLALQAAAIETLQNTVPIMAAVSGIYDGPPPRPAFPYIAIGDGVSTDWSSKTARGRDLRLVFTVWDDGSVPGRLHSLMQQVEDAVPTLNRDLDGWHVASLVFVRSFVARDADGPWAGMIEHRVRVLQS